MFKNQVFLIFADNSRSKQNKRNLRLSFVYIGKWSVCKISVKNIQLYSCWSSSKFFFFLSSFFFTNIDYSNDSSGKEGTIFYSTLPLPPVHEHSDIYLQLCMWDNYHVFLIATLAFTRLILDEIYHLIKLPFDWLTDDAMFVLLLDDLIWGFCYSILTPETGEFELASTITLALQANRLTKCASHPKCSISQTKYLFSQK